MVYFYRSLGLLQLIPNHLMLYKNPGLPCTRRQIINLDYTVVLSLYWLQFKLSARLSLSLKLLLYVTHCLSLNIGPNSCPNHYRELFSQTENPDLPSHPTILLHHRDIFKKYT